MGCFLNPYILGAVGLLFALSLGSNVALYKLHTGDLKRVASLQGERDQALAAGKACSEGTARLRAEADARAKRDAEASRLAADAFRRAERGAQATLQTPPTVPHDACASLDVLNRRELAERRR